MYFYLLYLLYFARSSLTDIHEQMAPENYAVITAYTHTYIRAYTRNDVFVHIQATLPRVWSSKRITTNAGRFECQSDIVCCLAIIVSSCCMSPKETGQLRHSSALHNIWLQFQHYLSTSATTTLRHSRNDVRAQMTCPCEPSDLHSAGNSRKWFKIVCNVTYSLRRHFHVIWHARAPDCQLR